MRAFFVCVCGFYSAHSRVAFGLCGQSGGGLHARGTHTHHGALQVRHVRVTVADQMPYAEVMDIAAHAPPEKTSVWNEDLSAFAPGYLARIAVIETLRREMAAKRGIKVKAARVETRGRKPKKPKPQPPPDPTPPIMTLGSDSGFDVFEMLDAMTIEQARAAGLEV